MPSGSDEWTFEATCVGDGGGGEVAPALVGSHPVPGSLQVRTIWPTLTFAEPAAPLAVIPYDRSDPSRYAPFPDDIWLTSDPSTETGARVDLPVPDREPDVENIFSRTKEAAGELDGFSPIGALVVELPDAPDASSLPRTQEASLAMGSPKAASVNADGSTERICRSAGHAS